MNRKATLGWHCISEPKVQQAGLISFRLALEANPHPLFGDIISLLSLLVEFSAICSFSTQPSSYKARSLKIVKVIYHFWRL